MEKRKERGVTLVETIVAMTLVVLISVFVLFTCDFSIEIQGSNVTKRFFAMQTENIAMCYYHASTENFEEDFDKEFSFLTELEESESQKLYDYDSENYCITILYDGDFSYLEYNSTNASNAKYKLVFDISSSKITCSTVEDEITIFESEV